MNPWQTWLQSLSQQQNSSSAGAEAFNTQWNTQWQATCQQWQKSMEGFWESPSAYWQTVSSIQSARARTIASFWQQQPGYFTALFQCKSFPQLVELCTRWNGHNLNAFISLNTVTQAQRSNLLGQWQRQLPFLSATSPTALASMWKFSFSQQQSTQPSQQSNPTSSATIVTPVFKAPQASASTSPSSSVIPQPAVTGATVTTHPAQPQATPAQAQAQTSLNLSTPLVSESSTSLTSDATPTISSTANSVMRTSSGSTIAAAAARRSVVARRSSNNRRRAAR